MWSYINKHDVPIIATSSGNVAVLVAFGFNNYAVPSLLLNLIPYYHQ